MRNALYGGDELEELTIITMAQAWNVPPWVVEQDCSLKWYLWYSAYNAELALYRQHERDKLNG